MYIGIQVNDEDGEKFKEIQSDYKKQGKQVSIVFHDMITAFVKKNKAYNKDGTK